MLLWCLFIWCTPPPLELLVELYSCGWWWDCCRELGVPAAALCSMAAPPGVGDWWGDAPPKWLNGLVCPPSVLSSTINRSSFFVHWYEWNSYLNHHKEPSGPARGLCNKHFMYCSYTQQDFSCTRALMAVAGLAWWIIASPLRNNVID